MKLRVLMSGDYTENTEKFPGGGYSLIFDMLKFMENKSDIDFHLLTLIKGRKKSKIVKRNGITYHFIPKSKLSLTLGSILSDRIKIRKYVKQINPDVLHSHGDIHPSTLVGLKINKPHILTIHGIVAKESQSWTGFRGKIKRYIKINYEKKVMKKIKHVIGISQYVKDELQRIYPDCKPNYYVYNAGVSKDWLNNKKSPDDGKHLLFVGGIEERKGLIYLLKAFKIINKTNPKIILDIIGSIRRRHTYQELLDYVNNNNLSEVVYFHHNITNEELKKFYRNCTIFILPSLEESLGIVTMEAMSYGKPVVLSNSSVNPTIVTHMKNGLLANNKDPKDFAKNIQLLLNSKELRDKLGTEAMERVKDYSIESHCEKVYKLYKRLGNKNKL